MSKIGELILGIAFSIIGIPSKEGVVKMICKETLCSPQFQTEVSNMCWYCTLISVIFLIAGIVLVIDAIKEWT